MKRLTFLIVTMFLLTGCISDFDVTNVEELLVAPQPTELQGAAFDAIKNHAGDQAVIITPSEGADTGALIIDDGSFSGEESVITFYSNNNSGTDINIALLREDEDILTVQYAIGGLGNDVESVEFSHLERGDKTYLMVSYSGVTSNERYLAIYSYNLETQEMESVFAQDYRAMLSADIVDTQEQELIFALPSTREGALNIRIISLASGTPTQLYYGAPNPNIMEAKQLSLSEHDDAKYIAIDGIDSNNNFTSDMFYYNNAELYSLLEDQSLLTHNTQLLLSADIDGDGVVEQPTILPQPDGLDSSGYFMVGYYDIATNQQSPKYIGLVNTRLAFLILIPPHWYENLYFIQRDGGFTAFNADQTTNLFSVDIAESSEDVSSFEGNTQQVMLLGSFRVYLTTFEELTDYELSFLRDGIQQMY